MTAATPNVFADLEGDPTVEQFVELLSRPGVKIERIVSHGQASPPGFWYDQDWAEWVLVLRGSAGLLFEGDEISRPLRPGDHVHIAAHRRHRVEWTDAHEPTVWLAVHFAEP
jgi:cupin 2 domain-containing protein